MTVRHRIMTLSIWIAVTASVIQFLTSNPQQYRMEDSTYDEQQRHRSKKESTLNEQHLRHSQNQPWRKWINGWDGTTTKNETLNFVHITKTSGTSIEVAAAQVGINWGACHWNNAGAELNCTADLEPPNIRAYVASHVPFTQNMSLVGKYRDYWHLPHYFFQENPYAGSTIFTVVRNPYERILSEFYCPWHGYLGKHAVNIKFMKSWLQKMNTTNVNETMPINTEQYSLHNNAKFMNSWLKMSIKHKQSKPVDNGHLLPQYLYMYDDMGKQIVDHVLYYESLDTEFPMFMKMFGLPVVRSKLPVNARNGTSSLTVANLSNSSIYAINSMYRKDFEMFDYKMVNSTAELQGVL